MAASSTNEDSSPVEAAMQQELRLGTPWSLQGYPNLLPRPTSQRFTTENVSQLRKKSATITSRKTIADMTQQRRVHSSRVGHGQEIPAGPFSLLNSPTGSEKLSVQERLEAQLGVHGHYSKDADEVTENALQTESITGAASEPPASDADNRVIMEQPLRDMQVEVLDKSEKSHQYLVLGSNGRCELKQQKRAQQAKKKQRKACRFKTRFSDYTKNVLEHAYEFNAEGSSGRKHLDTGIVKKLSDKCGISNEQVKQWVRNKNKKVRRRYSMLEPELDLRGDKDTMSVGYQLGKMREDSLRPSFTLNQ